jgi:hypothetical protein
MYIMGRILRRPSERAVYIDTQVYVAHGTAPPPEDAFLGCVTGVGGATKSRLKELQVYQAEDVTVWLLQLRPNSFYMKRRCELHDALPVLRNPLDKYGTSCITVEPSPLPHAM